MSKLGDSSKLRGCASLIACRGPDAPSRLHLELKRCLSTCAEEVIKYCPAILSAQIGDILGMAYRGASFTHGAHTFRAFKDSICADEFFLAEH